MRFSECLCRERETQEDPNLPVYNVWVCTRETQLCFLWFDAAPCLLSFVKMYAMATLAPKLEWPRDRHTAPPRSSNPLASNFLDGLLEITRASDSLVTWSWMVVRCAGDMFLVLESNQAGTYTRRIVSHKPVHTDPDSIHT